MAMKITIDPGHGKTGNKSPNNTKYIEGTQMWHLANKLKAALEGYGFEVAITRPNITDNPSLADRGGAAGKNGSCMFLSLHSNAPGKNADGSYSSTVTGSVVYYSMTRTENLALADKLGKKVSEIMGHYYRGSKTRQYPDKPGVDYYGVIRSAAQSGCKCAMLIEHGFHTNIADSNFLLDESNLKKLAEAEAKIIAEYFGVKKNAPENPDYFGTSNEETIYNYCTKIMGLNTAAACGILANFYSESGFRANNLQNTYEKSLGLTDDAYTTAVDNGSYSNFVKDSSGYGLAQWTYWSRKESLLAFAKEKSASIGDIAMQLDFFAKEIKGYTSVWNTITSVDNSAQGAYDSAFTICMNYEKPGAKETSSVTRGNLAKNTYFKKYYKEVVPKTLYRVQVGAYSVKTNADNMLKKLKASGFEGFIVEVNNTAATEPAKAETPIVVKKTVDELAKEVINGKWGNGTARKTALTNAGYDYSAVQARVNEILKK